MFEKEAEEYYYKTYPVTLDIGEEERKKEVTDIFLAGYNKANEWHYIKDAKCDEDLPQNKKVYYAYIVNVGTYDNPIIRPKLGSFSVIEFDIMAYHIIAWKEIVLPELPIKKEIRGN